MVNIRLAQYNNFKMQSITNRKTLIIYAENIYILNGYLL